MFMFNNKSEFKKIRNIIGRLNFFDTVYYLRENRDVRISTFDPFEHYCKYGINENRNPNKYFDTEWYQNYYEDVKEDGGYPIVHYALFGHKENRFINEQELEDYLLIQESTLFDSDYYLKVNKDLQNQAIFFNPLLHFVRYGWEEGRNPNGVFNIRKKSRDYINTPWEGMNAFVASIKIAKKLEEPKPTFSKDTSKNINNMNQISKEVENNLLPILKNEPLVSILVLTKDGIHHIKRLFKALNKNTIYKNFEIIVVDNASNDKTLAYLEENLYDFDLKIIANSRNETFSYANNQASKIAKGEYFLLLNNDVEPLYGWLTHLVYALESKENVGSVGAQLIYPYDINEPFSTKIQHAGIAFKYEYIEELKLDFFRPYNIGMGREPNIKQRAFNINQKVVLTAACLLVKKEVYFKVDGLDEGYNYGYEDVDFGLKLHQAGYVNYYCQNSILFHYESSTQKLESQKTIKGRRVDNIKRLHTLWFEYIKKNFFFEKFKGSSKLFSENKLKIAFAVTEAGEDAVAGDYFTALELAESFGKMGYEYSFLTRRGMDWYDIPNDVDIVVSMLDAYNLNQIKNKAKKIVSIAWIRNWPDRWLENNSFKSYDLVFASSQTLCDMIEENSEQKVSLFPIATNPEKFVKNDNIDSDFTSDYSFTGNYWGKPREIETFLEPSKIKHKFNIYGKDWNMVEKFAPYHKGFLQYKDIPKVYANSRIVIDDAVVGITKPYGSVNSRVFDAIAGGTLVVTNGVIGAKETFGELLPFYETKEELHAFLEKYLNNENLRKEKAEALYHFVLKHHTYQIRARQMKERLESLLGIKKSFVIKMPIPNWEEAKNWGDYHFALGLKKQLELKGYYCLLQILPEWKNEEGNACDIVLVLRGLSQYKVQSHQVNLMWNISHPDKVSMEEYNQYDRVFVASEVMVDSLKNSLTTKVEVLQQCTDPDVFKDFKDEKELYSTDLLFVGNSRNIFRKSLKYILPTSYSLSVFGTLWTQFIDKSYIKGEYIPNDEVYKYYSNAKIVLNDHWDDMRENGFISNRLFDVLACNGFILTDNVKGLSSMFDDTIVTYESKRELEDKIKYYLDNDTERKSIAAKGRALVLSKHTYKNRVETILESIEENTWE